MELRPEEVAAYLGIEAEELSRWEDGTVEPPVEGLWDLAELYGCGTDYFLTRTPPVPPEFAFRLPRRKAMRELALEARKVIIRFGELCRAAQELEKVSGVKRRVSVRAYPEEQDPNRLAMEERQRLGLGERPIPDLRAVIEEQGVRVFELEVPENEFSGFSWWHAEYGPCILVNGRDERGRRSFTLAHEYAHILRPDAPHVCDPAADIDMADERFANRFAVVLLMPASDVREAFRLRVPSGVALTSQQLGSLADRYRASLHATAIRLEEVGLVPGGTTQSLIAEWEARPRRYRAPRRPAWWRQLGENYVSLAFEAQSQGHISVGKLAQYLGLPVRKVIGEMEKRGSQNAGGS